MWERESGGGRGLEWHCENQGTKEMGGFPAGSAVKNPPAIQCNAGDVGLIPGSGRSPAEGYGNPPQYSCLGNSHGQRGLEGYSPWGRRRVGQD